MTTVSARAQFGSGTMAGSGLSVPGVQSALILIGAAGAALAVLGFGTGSLLVIPGAVAVLAVIAKPELGIYATLLALMVPIPVSLGPAVIYPHDAAAVLFAASAFAAALRARDFELPPLHYVVPAVAMVAIQIISLANSVNLEAGVTEVVQQFYLLLIMPAAFFLVLRSEAVLHRSIKLFMALMIMEVFLVCIQFICVMAGDESVSLFFAFGRDVFKGGPRVFGSIGPTVGMLLVASAFLWLSSGMRWTLKALVLCLHVFAILATGTRSAVLVLLVTLIFYGLFANRKGLSLKLLIPILAGGFIFAGVMGFSQFSSSLQHASDSRYRVPIDRKALSEVPNHPIIGHGPKAAADVSISIFGARKLGVENELVARIYENGVVGLAVLFVFASVPVLCSVWMGRRYRRTGLLAATLGAIIVGMYSASPAGCIFEGALGQWMVFFYAAMLAAACISGRFTRGARSCFAEAASPAPTNVAQASRLCR